MYYNLLGSKRLGHIYVSSSAFSNTQRVLEIQASSTSAAAFGHSTVLTAPIFWGLHCNWGCNLTKGLSWPLTVPDLSFSLWLLQFWGISCNWGCPLGTKLFSTTPSGLQNQYTFLCSAASFGSSCDLLWTTASVCWPWGTTFQKISTQWWWCLNHSWFFSPI